MVLYSKFLQTKVITEKWIKIDLWSFIHLFVGFFLLLILSMFFTRLVRFIILFVLLVLWEVFEYILYGVIKPKVIKGETPVGVFTDIWVGMLGGVIGEIFLMF